MNKLSLLLLFQILIFCGCGKLSYDDYIHPLDKNGWSSCEKLNNLDCARFRYETFEIKTYSEEVDSYYISTGPVLPIIPVFENSKVDKDIWILDLSVTIRDMNCDKIKEHLGDSSIRLTVPDKKTIDPFSFEIGRCTVLENDDDIYITYTYKFNLNDINEKEMRIDFIRPYLGFTIPSLFVRRKIGLNYDFYLPI